MKPNFIYPATAPYQSISGALSQAQWQQIKKEVFERDKHQCQWCKVGISDLNSAYFDEKWEKVDNSVLKLHKIELICEKCHKENPYVSQILLAKENLHTLNADESILLEQLKKDETQFWQVDIQSVQKYIEQTIPLSQDVQTQKQAYLGLLDVVRSYTEAMASSLKLTSNKKAVLNWNVQFILNAFTFSYSLEQNLAFNLKKLTHFAWLLNFVIVNAAKLDEYPYMQDFIQTLVKGKITEPMSCFEFARNMENLILVYGDEILNA